MTFDYSTVMADSGPLRSKKYQQSRQRWYILYTLLGIVMVILLVRSFYLQVIQGNELKARADNNSVAVIPITASRGIIFDAKGKQLVENVASTDLILDPATLPSEDNESILTDSLPKLAAISSQDVSDGLQKARATQRSTRLIQALDHDTVLAIEAARDRLPGVLLVSTLVRKYPFTTSAAHILGYTGSVSSEELESRSELYPTDITGKAGLEKYYDVELAGKHGISYVEIDAAGIPQKQLGEDAPQTGVELHLGIDIELQAQIVRLFSERMQSLRQADSKAGMGGAVIALDPRSGAVRALVSYPTFDPNNFSLPKQAVAAEELIRALDQPLFNRATDGMYPPGSTIKPFIAAAAVEEKVITPETTILSTGGLTVGPWSFPDWKAGGHGPTNVNRAMAESVNTFFYTVTGGYQDFDGLGVERTINYLRRFGWGEKTGVDLPTEREGFLPSPAEKKERTGDSWYIGDTYHLAIGQGDVLISPLQLAVATAAIANGGELYVPHLLRYKELPNGEIVSYNGREKSVKLKPETVKTVRASMRETVTGLTGSGRQLINMPIALAGKTGTAQIGGKEQTHAWFTSFGPYNDPELVITVLLEEGGEGDKDAVPFARKIWEWWVVNNQ